MISIVVAVGKNNEIGKDNKMLWHNPEDLAFFKNLTINHKVIMGKNTYLSIGKALKNRENIVLSRENISLNDAIVKNNLEEILKLYKETSEEVFVIGGESIYEQSIDFVDRIYISRIDETFTEANKFFPNLDKNKFSLIEVKKFKTFEVNIYERIGG